MQCKGQCGNSSALSPVACVPKKLHYKKIKMEIKTKYPDNKIRKISRLV